MREVWDACPRADWLLWILRHVGLSHHEIPLRRFTCACIRGTPIKDGRTVWDLLSDPRSRKAIEVVEAYCAGEGTAEDLLNAANAAYVAYAADAIVSGTTAAATTAAAYVAHAATAAYTYADAAVYAADYVADDAAAARLWQANELRKHIPNPF